MNRSTIAVAVVSFAAIAWLCHVNGQAEKEISTLREGHINTKLERENELLSRQLAESQAGRKSWYAAWEGMATMRHYDLAERTRLAAKLARMERYFEAGPAPRLVTDQLTLRTPN